MMEFLAANFNLPTIIVGAIVFGGVGWITWHSHKHGGCSGCSGGCGGGFHEPYVETRTFTEIVTLTEENFQTEVLDDPGLIIIDFWAEWCQPCKMMAPVFAELNAEENKVKFCKVNVDEQPNLATMFGIDSIPTLAVVQDRHTLTGMVGVHDKADIKEMLEKCRG